MDFRGIIRGLAGLGAVLILAMLVDAVQAETAGKKSPTSHDHGTENFEVKDEANAMEHVLDDKKGGWHLFESFGPRHLHLPKILGFQVTKFMMLELLAALAIAAIYIPLARRMCNGEPARGGWDNTFDFLLDFIRNEVARPAIGEHDADKYLPFLWTMFLFILFNNLLGVFPFGASATASIYVTGALALLVFFAIHGSAVAKMGLSHYLKTMWPHMDVPFPLGFPIKLLVCLIEVVGTLVKNAVLAVRLFANMFAGHMVLATILLFIKVAAGTSPALWGTITAGSILGIIALSFLEIFVAFLQAYIFVFLTALFMGMALHPQH